MSNALFATTEYQELISSHLNESIKFLFAKDQEFALACDTKFLSFEPELPDKIKKSFGDTVLFIISGFTYETAQLDDEHFSFEAGFGDESFGSSVTLPLLAIKQIFVGDYPIAINASEPTKKSEDILEANSIKSMEALLNNPENKKLLKKKKL